MIPLRCTFFIVCIAAAIGTIWSQKVEDFQACDRSCRYVHGFFDRSITGTRVGREGRTNSWGSKCKCFKNGKEMNADLVERVIKNKKWYNDTWNGPGNNYTTAVRCVLRNNSAVTLPSMSDRKEGDVVLHCGACSACSTMHDLQVIYNTREYITGNMTECSTAFASPFSKESGDLDALRNCLIERNIDFSDHATGSDRPTCMDCWLDNIMNDAVYCKTNPSCIWKFFDPANNGAYAGCLKCDEENSGAEFIRCAGSNRRSSGISSDIDRGSYEICRDGYYYKK